MEHIIDKFVLNMGNIGNYFSENNNQCEVFVKDIYQQILGESSRNLFYSSFGIIVLVILYLSLDIYKLYRIERKYDEKSEIEELIRFDSKLELIKRTIVFLIFIIGSRLIQISIWSL